VKRHLAIGLVSSLPLLALGSPARSQERISSEQRASLTEIVAQTADAPQAIGFSVGIARHADVVYAAARGKRSLDPDERATVDTWYGIGSVTKQFTAALIMQFVESGRLHLDDRLATVLPDFPHASEITIRQLLTHTSGLANYSGKVFSTGLAAKRDVQPAELVALIAGEPLEFTPGSTWEYCNTNYLALGLVIEKLSGKPYGDVVRERIIVPLGIAVSVRAPSSVSDVAQGYSEGSPPKGMTSDVSWAYAAGELYATVRGLLAWDAALFGGRVVSARSLAQMTKPVVLPDGKPTNYGFGLAVAEIEGRPIVSHNGGVPGGFAAQNFVFPDDGVAIVTLANTLDFNAALPATQLAEVFYPDLGAALQSFSEEQLAAFDDPRIDAQAKEWLGRLTSGSLDKTQMSPEMIAALTPAALKGGQDFLRAAGAVRSIRLAGFTPQSGFRVYVYRVTAAARDYTFTFVLDGHGKIAGLFVKP